MRIRNIEISRMQVGWYAEILIRVTTSHQFTDEEHACEASGSSWWLALYRALRVARRVHRQFSAKPGERAAKGWA
jgi:hypothetical protein